ncbi:hypothetical protein VOLCADRAFT_107374 [Volvox carteri f. nagariensis]|uniref:Uncharacterized protein n=1 Tax=Volvox carteri f. nagariensis TaxID=3068 RepID=D8UDL1_VOLCA|nr:uncharacterized protein VOLCADRAFT_107374 [Volvox carteri f. nagariensis]EFJ42213.1 hypothetical protein VOLCADRAFT_107374 [Volvox carteri f. nagariensis]|eukprot:XP_002956756.1 hypothetical protein VOLCADRAFT_107374 [Volvox carteri f. nagariensis]
MLHETQLRGAGAEAESTDNNATASTSAIGAYAWNDPQGAPDPDPTTATSYSSGGGYGYNYGPGQEPSAGDGYGYSNGNAYAGASAEGITSDGAVTGDGRASANNGRDQGVDSVEGADGGDTAEVAATTAADASAYSWPADPEGMLTLLQQQRQQYRSWVAQCASTALAALDPSHSRTGSYAASYPGGGGGASPGVAGPFPDGAIPDDVLGLVEAMDVAGTVRQYMLSLKAAAESVRNAARAGANFEALSLPVSEAYDDPSDPAAVEAEGRAEAEFVSAAYGVTSAIATARAHLHQLKQLEADPAAALVQEVLSQRQAPAEGGAGLAADAEGGPVAQSAAAVGSSEQLVAPLESKLERVGAGLCHRLRQEAEGLMPKIQWPPPLADGGGMEGGRGVGSAAPGVAGPGSGAEGTLRSTGAPALGSSGSSEDALFRGFEQHPLQARKLVGVGCGGKVGVLTALTHYQMAVEQRTEFYQLLSGGAQGSENKAGNGGDGDTEAEESDGASGAKPLLWAAKVLAEPVAAKLRAHFQPAAPTGRLDRPAWLYCTVLEFVRQHGHALASLDDMLACLQLKPHYNMPAEFARAMQDAVLALLRDLRIPALLELRNQGNEELSENGNGLAADGDANGAAAAEAEADALLLGLMDASAAYDMAMLPLLGATGSRVEADAARGMAMLSAAAAAGGAVLQRRRACDQFDPTAVGTADMHARYVAVAAAGPGPAAAAAAVAVAAAAATKKATRGAVPPAALPSLLQAWAAAEGAAALRAVEAVVYDESSLVPAEEAAARALGGGFSSLEDEPLSSAPPTSFSAAASSSLRMGGGLGASSFTGGSSSLIGSVAPWQRDTWPPVLAREAAALLDGLVARSKWLSANPVQQREFLEAAASPMLALLRKRLSRLLDQAVSRGEVVSEEGLPKVCATLCAAHFLYDHLQSLLLTDLAPLVQALLAAAAPPPAAAAGEAASGAATPPSATAGVPAGKLGAGGGGFWSGLIAVAAGGGGGGGSGGVPASPARLALRDGVTALAAGAGGGATTAAAVAAAGGWVAGCSVAYRHAIEANPQFPFTPESDAEEAEDGFGGVDGSLTASTSLVLLRPSHRPLPRRCFIFSSTFVTLLPWQQLQSCVVRLSLLSRPGFCRPSKKTFFLQSSLERLSRCCDKATFFDVWRGAALSINRFMFNFIATESRFTRAGARQFAADVAGLAQLFAPYSRRGGGGGGAATRPGSFTSVTAAGTTIGGGAAAGNQHFRELQAAARLLCLGDEEAADVMRRASAAAVAAAAATSALSPYSHSPQAQSSPQSQVQSPPPPKAQPPSPHSHTRGDPVRSGMSSDPILSAAGLACLSPLQIMNVIEHSCDDDIGGWRGL